MASVDQGAFVSVTLLYGFFHAGPIRPRRAASGMEDHQAYKCLPPRKTRCNASAAVSGSEHPECSDGAWAMSGGSGGESWGARKSSGWESWGSWLR